MDGGFYLKAYKPAPYADATTRIQNFEQVIQPFSKSDAQEQAGRCITCDSPGCNTGCPVGQQIPLFLKAAGDSDWREAHEIAIKSPLYGLFGLICPQQEGLCESSCTIGQLSTFGIRKEDITRGQLPDTIAVGAVENFIWRNALENGWLSYPRQKSKKGKSVAIVGAGPAGIYSSIKLNQSGFDVTVYDAWEEIGGLLRKGIPDFKLDKSDLPIVRAAMETAGIKFELNTRISSGSECRISLQELLATHDATLLATGTYAARDILHPETQQPIAGHDLAMKAMDYLIPYNNQMRFGPTTEVPLSMQGKDVIVIGPGDTGMDCVRSAMRAGAANVFTLMRSASLRGAVKERSAAKAENEALRVEGKGGMQYRQLIPLEIRESNGRLELVVREVDGIHSIIPADVIINATGFLHEQHANIYNLPELEIRPQGTTNIPGLFVAGDAKDGATLAVKAAAGGRYAAALIGHYLAPHKPTSTPKDKKQFRAINSPFTLIG